MTFTRHALGAISAVPAGSAVLHIGPHKTGTSALQEAMRRARGDLLAQGVRLAGLFPGDADGVRYAISGRPRGDADEARRAWERIKAELTDTSVPRRVYSRETFANAGSRRAGRLLEELGHGSQPVHVVLSARPLAQLIPSQYSQFVQRGLTHLSFEEWVRALLDGDAQEPTASLFWKRHDYAAQIRRWGGVVATEKVTLIVVDSREPLLLPEAFERLLDLRPGTLADNMEHDLGNRSLTLAELDLIRQWHEITAPTGVSHGKLTGLAWRLAHHLRRFNPEPVDPRPTLPAWSLPAVAERAATSIASIAASGAQVAGDLSVLAAVPGVRQRSSPRAAGRR